MALCKCESVANYHKSHLKLLIEPQRAVKPSVPVWNEICFPLDQHHLRRLHLHPGVLQLLFSLARNPSTHQFSQGFLRTAHLVSIPELKHGGGGNSYRCSFCNNHMGSSSFLHYNNLSNHSSTARRRMTTILKRSSLNSAVTQRKGEI